METMDLGERLRIARANANLTQEAVARELGVARTTLVAIERGNRPVKNEELLQFSRLYGISAGRLTSPDTVHVDLSAKFRRREDRPNSASSDTGVALLNSLVVGAVELEKVVGAKLKTDYPPALRISASVYLQQAEDAAVALRHRLGVGLGRVNDLLSAFELELGIRVFFRPLKDSNISGMYAFDHSVGACILVNSNHPRHRRLQTLSHEAGHFLTDRSFADILDDEPIPLSLEERFARRFGPAFLMPAPSLRARFSELISGGGAPDVRTLVLLAHQFDVSTEAMCRRLENLGLLADGMWQSLKDRGFNRDIELQVIGDPEPEIRPPLVSPRLAYLAARALHAGLLSSGQLCEMLHVDRLDLHDAVTPFSDQSVPIND